MSAKTNSVISAMKSLDPAAFLIHFVVNGYIPKCVPKEVEELIVLFTFANGDFIRFNSLGTFVTDVAPTKWHIQINLSFSGNKLSKLVNTQMSKDNIPVYLPYVVNRNCRTLKQRILYANGVNPDLHEEYTLWMRKRWQYKRDGRRDFGLQVDGTPEYTGQFYPDIYDNMKLKKLYITGGKGYFPASRRELEAGKRYILSKEKPQHREHLYGLKGFWWDFTKEELLSLWEGKDLRTDDPASGKVMKKWV